MTVSSASATVIDACDGCLRRTDLLAGVAARLDIEWRRRRNRARVLALPDAVLLELDPSAGILRRYESFRPAAARAAVTAAGLSALCRCGSRYPDRLRELEDPPAVVHVAGGLCALYEPDSVGIVGARRATAYGLEVSRELGRALSTVGVPVISGLALGVDSAAHAGAVEGTAAPVAVLAGGADVPYPARMRTLHARVVRRGCVISELPPGFGAHRWCFVARNRLIAALSAVTVVVEAAERSGSLTTADFAAQLGRTVGAVPGPVTSPLSAGTNALIESGAALIRDARDVVEHLSMAPAPEQPPDVSGAEVELGELARRVLAGIEAGDDTLSALAPVGEDAGRVLGALTELELAGLVRRHFGGRYVRVPAVARGL